MITLHHSFSTRIFLDGPTAASAGATPAPSRDHDNLREFWWFLRSGPSAAPQPPAGARPRVGTRARLHSGSGHAH